MSLSVVIPTYGRDEVLTDTITQLLAQSPPAAEILVVDQTTDHGPRTTDQLTAWDRVGAISWIRHQPPGTVGAMNRGLVEARHELVLFLDDDIGPGAELVATHVRAHEEYAEAWAVVGRVLQPEDTDGRMLPTNETNGHDEDREDRRTECASHAGGTGGVPPVRVDSRDLRAGGLARDLAFRFNGNSPAWVTNVMAGNLSVKRERALALGGFDANFTPPVAYRFETEFAKRLVAAGGRIRFEPRASIDHLRASRGGTRSLGSHLTSPSPVHGVGDYYYALRCGRGWERFRYILRRPFREVRTRFHLRHPWYIPVKLVGELRAMLLALRLSRRGPRLLSTTNRTDGHE